MFNTLLSVSMVITTYLYLLTVTVKEDRNVSHNPRAGSYSVLY